MKNKNRVKQFLAMMLVWVLTLQQAGISSLAEEAAVKETVETQNQTKASVDEKAESEAKAKEESEARAKAESGTQAKAESALLSETVTEKQTEEKMTEKVTEAQTEKRTEAETEAQTEKRTEAETEAQTEKRTEAETEAQTEKRTEAETEVQTEKRTEAETEPQTEKKTEEETEIQTEKESETRTEDPAQSESTEKESETSVQEEFETRFAFRNASFDVQVVLSDENAMSAQAVFQAEEKDISTDYFENAYRLVEAYLENHGMTVLDGYVYDMGFFKEGKETEPSSGTAEITMQYVHGLDLQISDLPGASVQVFHIETDAAAGQQKVSQVTRSAVLNDDGTVRSVKFVLDGFSPVVVAGVIDISALQHAEGEEAALYENDSTTVDLTSYIKNVTVEYYDEEKKAWTEYTAGTELSGNARVRLNAEFSGLPWEELKNSGYSASTTYQMPGFADFEADSNILGPDSKPCGRLHAANGTVVLTFDPDYFHNVDSGNIMGTFQLEAEADWTEIPGDSFVTVKVGDVEKQLLFEDNLTAKYSDVTVDKQAGSIRPARDGETDGYYIDYTVTLTVTGNKTVPAVTVKDEFDSIQVKVNSENGQTVDGSPQYVAGSLEVREITEYDDETVPGAPNPIPVPAVQTKENGKAYLFWNLGDVVLPDVPSGTASRTFQMTYTAKLSDDYVKGGCSQPITNVVTPAANGVEKTPNQEIVGVKADLSIKKELVNDSVSAGSLYYRNFVITVTAPADNTYTLPHVVIRDTVDAGTGGNPYISFADGLYTRVNQSTKLPEKDESKYNFYLEKKNSDGSFSAESYGTEKLVKEDNRNFSLDIGALAPGETKRITYTVKIDAGAYTDSGNRVTNGGQTGYTKVTLNNTAYTSKQDLPGMGEKKSSVKTDSLEKTWLRKMEGSKVTEGTACFAGTEHAFTAASNTFEYHLLVNEEADMTMASPFITDSLGTKMKFTGYVRIERYTREQMEASLSGFPDAWSSKTQGRDLVNAMENLRAAQTPDVTWQPIDGTSFTISLPENTKDCYYITYYAVVDDTNFAGTVTSVNSVSLGGISGTGSGANFRVDVELQTQISGSTQLSVDKEYWYHTGPDYSDGSGSGDIYWKVKIRGTVPEGYYLKDVLSNNRVDLEGVYRGEIGNAKTVEQLSELAGVTEIPEYTGNPEDAEAPDVYYNGEIIPNSGEHQYRVNFPKGVTATEDDPVYVVFRTHYIYNGKAPDDSMWGGQSFSTYKNSVSIFNREGKSVAEDKDVPATILVKDKRLTKACLCMFYYDGTTIPDMSNPLWKKDKESNGGKYEHVLIQNMVNKAIQNGQITERGYYLIWNIKVNHMSDMEGKVQITESLPDGLKFRFVDFYWANSAYGNQVPTVSASAVPGSTGTVQMEIEGLKAHTSPTFNKYAAEFSVCTQIDDADLRTCGTRTYENSAALNYNDCTYTADSSIDVSLETLSKKILSETPSADGTYSFRLLVNEDGIDWHSDTGKMELYDELSSPLELLTDTITVTNTATKTELAKGTGEGQWNVSYDSEKNGVVTWKFILPDDEPLEIVYQTRVSALPNTGILVSNKAHWEATQTTNSSTVEKQLKYSASATAKLENPQLVVTKKDAEDTDLKLSGAEFTLQPVTKMSGEDGSVSWVNDGTALIRTTGDNGEASFSGSSLIYDQVYRLSETKAPDGYDKDENTYLLVFSLTVDTNTIAQWQQDGILVNQSYYNKEAFNKKKRGSLSVTKSVTGNTAPANVAYTVSAACPGTDLSSVTAKNDRDEEVTISGGKLTGTVTFSLRADETVTLSGLPYGAYTVSELTGADDKFEVTYAVTGDSESADPVSVTVGSDTPDVTVKNAYPYEEKVVLKGSKNIEGSMPSDQTFTFELNGTGMTETDTETLTTPIGDTANSFTFDELVFHSQNLDTGANVYEYTVKEQHPAGAEAVTDDAGKVIGYRSAGIVYDATIYDVKITVTKAADSSLTKKVEVKKNPEAEKKYVTITADPSDGSYALTDGATFTNTYSEIGNAELKVQKHFAGVFPAGGFAFQVTPENGAANKLGASFSGLDENGQIRVTDTTAVSVGTLQFTEDGTYEYSISEVIPDAAKNNHNVSGNIKYDSTRYEVQIEVSDGTAQDGNKTVTVSIRKEGETDYKPVTSGIFTAEFTNTQAGSLKVSKQVSSDGEKDKAFTFTVTLKNSDNTPYTGKVRIGNQEQAVPAGTITFDLKHHEEKVICEIPYGVQYEVTETSDADYTPSVAGSNASGTIGEDTPDVTAAYTNTRKKGSLYITKNVTGVYTPDADSYEDTFYFTVQDNDGYYYNASGEKLTENLNSSAVLTMHYKAGDNKSKSLFVTGLLSGETYTVTEVEKTGENSFGQTGNGYKYQVSYDSLTTADSAQEQKAIISSVPATVAVTNRLKKGNAYFTKKDSVSGELLYGAAFKLEEKTGTNTSEILTFTTGKEKDVPTIASIHYADNFSASDVSVSIDADSKVTIGNLHYGTYVLTETLAPIDYETPLKGIEFTIDSTTATAIGTNGVVTNERQTGSISFKKVDSRDIDKLVGASFTLQKKNTVTTEGYRDYVSFSIVKKAGGTGYEIKDFTNVDSVTCTMAEDGTVTIGGLFWDTYRLVETSAETGYELTHVDGTDFIWISGDITIPGTAPDALAKDLGNITNSKQTRDLSVTKQVVGTEADQSAAYVFKVRIHDGYAGKNTGNTNYKYTWKIKTGTAAPVKQETEIEANVDQTISLRHDQTAIIEGLPYGAAYTVTEETDSLSNMQAKVTDVSGGAAVLTGTEAGVSGEIADTDAAVTFTNTRLEDITLTKNQVGGSTDETFTFTLHLKDTPEGVNYDVDYTNSTGSLAFVVPGSAAAVTHGNNTIILKDDMTAKIRRLPYGTKYEITEQKEEGSLYDTTINHSTEKKTTTGELTVGTNNRTTFNNTHVVRDLVLSKTVEEGDQAKLFTFTLNLTTLGDISEYTVEYHKNGQPVAETDIPAGSEAKVHAGNNTIKLSHGMTATVKGLEVGTGYTVTEDPGTDYDASAKVNGTDVSLSNNGVSGTITSGQENTAAFTNTRRTKDVTFSKKAATGTEELPGAGLAVYKASDVTTTDGVTTIKTEAVPVDSWISVDKAHEVKGVLVYEGSYVLIETSAPVGYAFADPIFFHIDVNGKVFIDTAEQTDAVITMTDQPLHFTVNKVDFDYGTELEDARLELFVKNGEGTDTKVNGAEWTSAENTTFDFGSMLQAGKDYILRETNTPEGYRTIEDVSVSVGRDGTITTSLEKDTDSDVYLVKNEKTKAEILKIDGATGEPLPGAALRVVDEKGETVDEWTTDGNPHVITGKLAVGRQYQLIETSAPEPYEIAEPITFTLKEDGTTDPIVMKDSMTVSQEASIRVTKELTYNGEPIIAADQTFYVALFADEGCTRQISEVKAIVFRNASASTVEFTGLEIGRTYYVGETDQDGTVISVDSLEDGTIYAANFTKGNSAKIEEADGSKTILFENEFYMLPTGYYKSGELVITKKLLGADGKLKKSTDVFYAGIFKDASYMALADMVDRNVVEVALNGKAEASASVQVMVDPGEKVTLYVTETDAEGNPVAGADGFGYEVTVSETSVTIDEQNTSASVIITNQEKEETETEIYTEIETEFESESDAEKKTEKQTEEQTGEKSATSVKTGDDTPIALYLSLFLAAALTLGSDEYRRRRKSRKQS